MDSNLLSDCEYSVTINTFNSREDYEADSPCQSSTFKGSLTGDINQDKENDIE